MKKISINAKNEPSAKKKELMDKIKKKNEMAKLTMSIPVYLHQNLKIIAAKKRINMNDIVIPFLESYIEKNI